MRRRRQTAAELTRSFWVLKAGAESTPLFQTSLGYTEVVPLERLRQGPGYTLGSEIGVTYSSHFYFMFIFFVSSLLFSFRLPDHMFRPSDGPKSVFLFLRLRKSVWVDLCFLQQLLSVCMYILIHLLLNYITKAKCGDIWCINC